jgi:hypothetical protein
VTQSPHPAIARPPHFLRANRMQRPLLVPLVSREVLIAVTQGCDFWMT